MSEISGSIFRDDRSDKKREKKSDTSKEVGDNHVSYKEFMKIVKKTRIMPSSYKNFPNFDEISTEQQIEDTIVRKKKGHIDNEQTFEMYSGDISNDNTEESNKYVSYKEFLRRVKKTRVTPLSSEGLPNFGERSIEQPLNDIETGKKKVEIETKQTSDMHSGGINVDKAEESNKHVSYEDFLRRVKKTRITPLSTESLPNFETKPQKHIIIDCIGAKKEVDNDNENILVFKSKNEEKSSEKIEDTSKKMDNKTKKEPIRKSDEKIKEEKSKVEEERKKENPKSKEEIQEENEGSKDINREKDKSEEKIKSESSTENEKKREMFSEKKQNSEEPKHKNKNIELKNENNRLNTEKIKDKNLDSNNIQIKPVDNKRYIVDIINKEGEKEENIIKTEKKNELFEIKNDKINKKNEHRVDRLEYGKETTSKMLKESNNIPEKNEQKIQNSKLMKDDTTKEPDKSIKESKESLNEKNFNNDLLHPKLRELYNEYFYATGYRANYGSKLKEPFQNYIKDHQKLNNNEKRYLLDKIEKINEKNKIEEYIVNLLKNTKHSPRKIIKDVNSIGLTTTNNFVQKIIKNYRLETRKILRDTKYRDLSRNNIKYFFEKPIKNVIKKINTIRVANGEPILDPKKGPTQEQLRKYGYHGLLISSYKKGISLNDVLLELGYKINHDVKKYKDLTRKNVAIFFKGPIKEVITKINEKGKSNGEPLLDHKKAPTKRQLKQYGYGGLINAAYKKGISLNEIFKDLGFEVKYHSGRYKDLTKENAANYFREPIKEVKDKINKERKVNGKQLFSPNDAPTKDQLIKYGYASLIFAARDKKISYNMDILEKLDYNLNANPKKYEKLNRDTAANILNSAIKNVKKKLWKYDGIKLNELEVPTVEQFNKYNYGRLVHLLSDKGLNIQDIEEKLGYIPNYSEILSEVGKDTHLALERICIERTKKLLCDSFREVKVSLLENWKKPDFTIMRNKQFMDAIESKQNVIKINPQIKEINVDFYLGNDKLNIIEKPQKGYQGREKMLILLPLGASDEKSQFIPKDIDIPFTNHIRILNSKEFSEFLGLKGKLLNEYNKTLNLSKKAIYDTKSRKELKEIANESKQILKNKYQVGHKEFLKYIKEKQLTDLLYSDIPVVKNDKNSLKLEKINCFINKFTKDNNFSQITKKIAERLVENAVDKGFDIRKKELKYVAAGAVYLCSKYSNRPITGSKIGERSNIEIQRSSVYKRANELLTFLEPQQEKYLREIINLFEDHSIESALILKNYVEIKKIRKKNRHKK